MKNKSFILFIALFFIALSCSDNGGSGEDDTDSDNTTDSGGDGDSDTDSDTDSDSDSSTDSDTDTDTETDSACDPNAPDALETAIERGDPRCVMLPPVLDEAIALTVSVKEWQCDLAAGLYGDGPVQYAPGAQSQQPHPSYAATSTIIRGAQGGPLAIAGTVSDTRFAAFGSVPTQQFGSGSNLAFEAPFLRLLEWLLTGDAAAETARNSAHRVATLALSDSRTTELGTWLSTNAAPWTTVDCAGSGALTTCADGAELLVLGSNTEGNDPDEILAVLKNAIDVGIPVLYLHTNAWSSGELGDDIGNILGFTLPYGGNYWDDDAADWSAVSETPGAGEMACYDQDGVGSLQSLLGHLKNNDFTINWAGCENDNNCEGASGMEEFYPGAERIQAIARGFDARALDPFSVVGDLRFEKVLILLGDKYRETISYPMTKGVTNDTTFLSALLADYAVLHVREINPAQSDLGNFSPDIPDNHPTVSRAVSRNTRPVDYTTSCGVYALPGRTVTLTRTDSLDTRVEVFVNMLREGSAHIFGDDYGRPAFLWSGGIPINTGETLEFTSPHGGIVFARVFSNTSLDAVELSFENVAEHPVYSGPGTEDSFAAALDTTALGWAEILTPGMEIHSRIDLMQETVAGEEWNGDVATLVDWTWNYLYRDVFGLAGLVGSALTHPATVTSFCTGKGWDCTDPATHGMQYIQHGNMDRATCGYGCSGNPYDAYWAFSPLGWGDSHEIGHNLQRGHLKIYDDASGEVSNNIFPVHQWLRFNADGLGDQHGRELDFAGTYALLQSGQLQPDPQAAVKQSLWTDGGVFQRLVIYWQLAMVNADVAALGDNGWDLFRLLYLADRLFEKANDSDVDWLAARDSLGFSTYTRADAQTLADSNDFLLVSTSFITGRDHRALFEAWGITYSAKADGQISALALGSSAPLEYWVIPDENAFSAPYATPLPIDGTTAWPY